VHGDRSPEPGRLAVQRGERCDGAATGTAPAGWARAIDPASGRAWYSAMWAHASAGAPLGNDVASNDTATISDSVTSDRSAAGVMSIDSPEGPARVDTWP
jgi:hypothetical protein